MGNESGLLEEARTQACLIAMEINRDVINQALDQQEVTDCKCRCIITFLQALFLKTFKITVICDMAN